MKRFKDILFLARGDVASEVSPTVKKIIDLASQNEARLMLFDVVKLPDRIARGYHDAVGINELVEKVLEQRRTELQGLADTLENTGVEIVVKVVAGRDFIEVIREVVHNGHDLIIKVASPKKKIFSGLDFHLMRKCPCPVWLIKPNHMVKGQKILAAVDLEMELEEEGKALNTLIMDLATSMATWQKSELYIISCWSLYGEEAMRENPFIKVSEDKLNQLLSKVENENRQRFDQLTNRYSSVQMDKLLIKARPENAIPIFVKDHHIDTVVMGTIGRSGIPGFFIGNTAEAILHSIDSSVITLKPKGFVSPVV